MEHHAKKKSCIRKSATKGMLMPSKTKKASPREPERLPPLHSKCLANFCDTELVDEVANRKVIESININTVGTFEISQSEGSEEQQAHALVYDCFLAPEQADV